VCVQKFFSRFIVYLVGSGLLTIGVLILLVQIHWLAAFAMGTSALPGCW